MRIFGIKEHLIQSLDSNNKVGKPMFQSALILILMAFSLITHAALPVDPIQRCLDVRRLVDLTSREKMAAKTQGVLSFKFHKISASELPLENSSGNMNEVIQALNNQIENCTKRSGEFKTVHIANHKFTRREWCIETNKKMLTYAKAAQGNFQKFLASIKNEFDWYKSDGWPQNHAGFKKGEFQFTAYYAPTAIEARRKADKEFAYPIYSNPGVVSVLSESRKHHLKAPLCGIDPITKTTRKFCLKNADGTYSIVPDKEEIARGALHPKYVIGYVKDPNDPPFLMLQGSGSLILDGALFHLNYETANGRPRTMLSRIVQCAQDPTCGGNLDAMERCAKNPKCHDEAMLSCKVSKEIRQSAASDKYIRQFLNSISREKAHDLRNRDQSFVFFAKEDGGPYGSENISLTPHASCATDHRVIPIGMNFIYNSKNSSSWCIAQDAGGAIVGAHVDVYKGEGQQAGIEANSLNHPGSLYIALPKSY